MAHPPLPPLLPPLPLPPDASYLQMCTSRVMTLTPQITIQMHRSSVNVQIDKVFRRKSNSSKCIFWPIDDCLIIATAFVGVTYV